MDYNDLALFVRVVESQSFTAAAQGAGVQRSSVTRCVARLEKALGVRLMHRTTHQRGVTEAGRALYERIRGSFDSIDEAAEVARDQGGQPSGIVRLTAPPGMSMGGLPEAVALFAQRYPEIRVEVHLTSRRLDLVREGIDLALRAGRLDDSSLVARRVGSIHSGVFAAPSYAQRRGRPSRPAELATHPCIHVRGSGDAASWTLVGPEGGEKVPVAGAIVSDDMAFIIGAVKAGAGICSLPLSFVAHEVAAQSLERLLPEHYLAGPTLSVVLPSGALVPSRVSLLRGFLVEQLTPRFSARHRKGG